MITSLIKTATLLALALVAPATAQEPPAPVGPYSQAVRAGQLLFLSGQVAIDPTTGTLDTDQSIEEQTLQVWRNIQTILRSNGLDLTNVVKAQVYLTDITEFQSMNAAYATALGDIRPARTTVGVSALPLGARIEIAVVATRDP